MLRLPLELSFSRISVVARAIRESFTMVVNTIEDFTDPRYYPPKYEEVENVLRYFFFMVAIDHRTSRLKPFETYINGESYHGADLLYHLGILKYREDPDYFNPERMAVISREEVARWLRAQGGECVWDPEVRAELLRDAGLKLIRFFKGSVSELIRASRGYIRHPTAYGLGSLLKVFKAYSDPVEKKMFLFIKFVLRRGLIEVIDTHNIEVPVDNHLTRVALRLGLVRLDNYLMRKVLSRSEFTYEEDIELRTAVRRAYGYVSKISSIRPDYLDDFLWTFGRKYCTRENPACERSNFCPLSSVCVSHGKASKIVEHNYVNTFYY
ncbi:MAG: hypothetical protein QW630_00360 [Sulfolobales archaeon]